MPSLNAPPPLPAGGTIGLIAPASPYRSRSQLLRGIEFWQSRGFNVEVADGVHLRDGYHAGPAEQRAHDLQAMFADSAIDVVQCLQGGCGSHQLVGLLNFDTIRQSPKPFIGFSDITALHVALQQLADMVTFYGPGLVSMAAPETTEFTQERMLRTLMGDGDGPLPLPDGSYLRTITRGTASGQIVGGDLWELRETLGTPWEISTDGRILFFEEVNVPAWQIDGMLSQLRNCGKLDHVVGVVVGDLAGCDDAPGPWNTKSVEDVLEYYLAPLGVPVLYGLPLGHGRNLATIPLGVEATVDADIQRLTLHSAGTSAAHITGSRS